MYRNFIEECDNSKKIQRQQSTAKQTNLLKFVKDGKGDTASKINKISQFLLILRDHYIIRRLSDVGKEIRQAVCNLLTKQTKSYFLEIFSGKISSYYKFFLSDSVDSIKIQYLGLLYERIEKNILEEEELITKILSESRKIILNLCLKDENKLAKPAIIIIEILSEMNLLSDETVNSLLPHLFNSEIQIRNLITKVVMNTILNFTSTENKESNDLTLENFVEVIEFFYKLSANDNNMISILVRNFHSKSEFLKRYDYFFKLLSILLKLERNDNLVFNQPPNVLISTLIKTLSFTIRELQMNIESSLEKAQSDLCKNEEFINLFCVNIHNIVNNLMMDDIDNFNEILSLFEYFKIYDQNLIKFEEKTFSEILLSLQKAFFLNYNLDKIKLNSYEILMENLLKAIQTLKNNKQLNYLNQDSFDRLTLSLNESFINLYQKDISKKTNISSLNYQKIYTIYLQYLSLLKYNNLSNTSFIISESMFFIIRILNHCSQNYNNLKESNINDLIERIILVCLNLGNEIIFNEFNSIINSNNRMDISVDNKIKEFVNNRANFLLFIHNLIEIPDNNDNFKFSSILKLKTKGLCFLFEIYIYSTSEKLKENSVFSELYYAIPNLLTDILSNFLSKNILKFFDEFANLIIEKQREDEKNDEEEVDIEDKKSQESDEEIDEKKKEITENVEKKVEIVDEKDEILKRKKNEEFNIIFSNFKLICESFSRLLVLNLGIFKFKNFCSIYFECFILLKMPIIIKNITSIVIERILEKELENFVELDQFSKQNNPINIIMYFITKITIKLFTNKSTILDFREFDFSEKLNMINNMWKTYVKSIKQKRLKKKFKDSLNKDKSFFTNYIYNSLLMTIEQTEEFEENGKKEIQVKNIKMLEILQIFLKSKLFYEEKDYKQILVAFIKMCEDIDKLDNVNPQHYTSIARFKKLLVSKAKLYRTEILEDSKFKNTDKNDVIKEEDHEEDEEKGSMNNERKVSEEEKEDLETKSDINKVIKNKKTTIIKSSNKKKRNFDKSGMNEDSSTKKRKKNI